MIHEASSIEDRAPEPSENSEQRYTLAEAEKIIRFKQCQANGHNTQFKDMRHVDLLCTHCGRVFVEKR